MSTTDAADLAQPAVPPLVFDWHAEQKIRPDSLLPWLVVVGQRRADFDRLSEATDGFRRCELTMTLNGVPLDIRAFLDGIARKMEHAAAEEARRLVDAAGFDAIEEAVAAAREAVRLEMRARLRGAGVLVEEDDDDD